MKGNFNIYKLNEENVGFRDFLISRGFENLKNDADFNKLSKLITLNQLLSMKGYSIDKLEKEYEEYKNNFYLDKEEKYEFKVKGAVPCPIKVPLMELLKEYNEENKVDNVNYDFRTANLGMDFIIEDIEKGDYPDLITSAGYEFIINSTVNKRIRENYKALNLDYNDEILKMVPNIKDPLNNFHIIAMVPAVFIVNKKELNGRKVPKTWADLMSEEFENSLTIPMGDLDMYNALVITIYSIYKEEGLKKLKKAISSNLHPAQMVKGIRNNAAAVSLCPYFFATMIQSEDLEVIWPEDGAILSPVFLSVREKSANEMEIVTNYFNDKKVLDVFSNNGKFPVTSTKVDKQFKEGQKMLFAGWDILNNLDEHMKIIEKYFEIGDKK